MVDFHYPNLRRPSISKRVHLVMAFAPIAEDRTRICVRTYRNVAATPVMSALIEAVLRWFNDRVLAEYAARHASPLCEAMLTQGRGDRGREKVIQRPNPRIGPNLAVHGQPNRQRRHGEIWQNAFERGLTLGEPGRREADAEPGANGLPEYEVVVATEYKGIPSDRMPERAEATNYRVVPVQAIRADLREAQLRHRCSGG